MAKNQRGFSTVEVLLIIVAVALIGFVGWFVWHAKQNTTKNYNNVVSQPNTVTTNDKNTNSTVSPASTTNSSNQQTTQTTSNPPVGSNTKPTPITQPAATASGISGHIYNTTRCGNIPAGGSCNNPPQPYQATVEVQTSSGSHVTNFTSAADGSFKVDLAVGSYVLVPQSYNSGITSAASQSVTVTSNHYSTADINYSTATP